MAVRIAEYLVDIIVTGIKTKHKGLKCLKQSSLQLINNYVDSAHQLVSPLENFKMNILFEFYYMYSKFYIKNMRIRVKLRVEPYYLYYFFIPKIILL